MTEETNTTNNLWASLTAPDKTKARRIVVGVKVVDVIENRYGPPYQLIWAHNIRVLGVEDLETFDIESFLDTAVEAAPNE